MNETEKQLFHSCRKLLESNVDPITILDGLYQRGYLSCNQRNIIYGISRTNPDRTYIWNALLLLIPGSCELKCVLNVILDAGYSDIAMAIGQKLRMSIVPSAQDLRIHRTNTGDSSQRFAQKLFMNFKINTHNNVFVNPRQYCHEESQKYKIQLERYNGVDDDVRKGIADKYAACLLAEIDSHIMLYTRQFPTCDLIKRLKLLIPETSNSNITQLSYVSRLAMACALAGKEGEAEDHLQNAMGLSFFVGRCVEISNLLYIYVFSLLSAYEKCPTQKNRDKIIHIAELGLQSVEDETDPIREFWVRIFTLRIVYCLLGLSYRGDPIYGIIIDRFSIRKAKQLLTDIDKQWEKMETRRKIMYYVAKARIAELEHNYGYSDSVLHFLNLAINIGNEGEYGETQFVKLYALHFSPCLHQDQQSSVDSEKYSHLFATSYENNPLKDTEVQKADISSDPTEYLHSHTTVKELLTVCGQEETYQKVSNLSYTDDVYPTLIPFQSSDDTTLQASDDSLFCDDEMTAKKSPVKTTDNSLVVESSLSSVVQTYGVLKIYNNASTISVTEKNNVNTVLKSLNVTILPNEPDEVNLLNPNTIFETQMGSDTDSTVLSENTDPKLLTRDKRCTDNTDITLLTESDGSRVLTANTNPTHITGPKAFTDNTDPKALTDNTDPKISTDNTNPKISTDNTNPKISTDNTDPKISTDNTDLNSLTYNTDPKISTDNTDLNSLTYNTDPKISTDNTDLNSLTYNTDPKISTDNTDLNSLTYNTDPKISTDNTDLNSLTYNTNPKISTANTDPKALTDNTDLNSLTDNTDPKISTDNTNPKILTDNTHPKILTDNTHPKILTDNTHPKILTDNTNPKILTDNTHPKILTDNTHPKILTDNTHPKILTDNTHPKSMTDINHVGVLGMNDTEETFHKTTMASPKNDDSDNLRIHNQDRLNHDSLPFQDIHKFDKQQ